MLPTEHGVYGSFNLYICILYTIAKLIRIKYIILNWTNVWIIKIFIILLWRLLLINYGLGILIWHLNLTFQNIKEEISVVRFNFNIILQPTMKLLSLCVLARRI